MSVEGAEDDASAARRRGGQLLRLRFGCRNWYYSIRNTRFTCQILESSIARGALFIGVSSNPRGRLIEICRSSVGNGDRIEVLAGSTRLRCGYRTEGALEVFRPH